MGSNVDARLAEMYKLIYFFIDNPSFPQQARPMPPDLHGPIRNYSLPDNFHGGSVTSGLSLEERSLIGTAPIRKTLAIIARRLSNMCRPFVINTFYLSPRRDRARRLFLVIPRRLNIVPVHSAKRRKAFPTLRACVITRACANT
jgi:hypothetical protein